MKAYGDLALSLVSRLRQKSGEAVWGSGDIETFLWMQPAYQRVGHAPLLTGADWQPRWFDWADLALTWMEGRTASPQLSHESRDAQLKRAIAQRTSR